MLPTLLNYFFHFRSIQNLYVVSIFFISESVFGELDQCDGSKGVPYHAISATQLIEKAVLYFQNKLKEQKYHGHLFDRRKAKGKHLYIFIILKT